MGEIPILSLLYGVPYNDGNYYYEGDDDSNPRDCHSCTDRHLDSDNHDINDTNHDGNDDHDGNDEDDDFGNDNNVNSGDCLVFPGDRHTHL